MRQAPVVSHIVERLQRGDAGLENARGHLRFQCACLPQMLHILAEEAVQRLISVYGQAASLAKSTDILGDESVQAIKAALQFVAVDCVPDSLCDDLEVALVPERNKCVKFLNRIVLQQSRDGPLALLDQRRVLFSPPGRPFA